MVLPQTIWIVIVERFLQRHQSRISGVLSGFDRLVFRGTIRSICHSQGMERFLCSQRILYKDYEKFVTQLTEGIKEHAKTTAEQSHRPHRYLDSAEQSKEDLARSIQQKDGIEEGLVCVLSCVEPCQTFTPVLNKASGHLELRSTLRKCLHVYFYYVDREFGLMHVRLQTWAPFGIQICINGREYLGRQLTKAGIDHEQRDNCFVRIDDLAKAQALLDRLVAKRWPRFLQALAHRHNPWMGVRHGLRLLDYYWTTRQAEWATDVMFRDDTALQELYPTLVHHAMMHFRSRSVMRFLGRRTNVRFNGEVRTKQTVRPEGTCVKHSIEENSLKMYDKQGCVLRIETTINQPRRFRVRRRAIRKGKSRVAWVPMRKGVADLPRLAELSQAANRRYLEALAMVDPPRPASEVLDPVSRRLIRKGRTYRGLRPLAREEAKRFAILLDGAFRIQGFRNADLRRELFPKSEADPLQRRRAGGQVTRYLRLLREHGIIQKAPGRRYYRLTNRGTETLTTALQLREINLELVEQLREKTR
jgi:hypothetical protein